MKDISYTNTTLHHLTINRKYEIKLFEKNNNICILNVAKHTLDAEN